MSRVKQPSSGFTLVEVVVIAPIVLIATSIIMVFLINMFISLGAKVGIMQMESDAQLALFSLRDDGYYANYFSGQPQPSVTDTYKSSWNAITDNALILQEIAMTAPRQIDTSAIVYKRDTPAACDNLEGGTNQFSTNTLIYFVQNATLYRRALIPSQTPNCTPTYRHQTCPSANATPTCPADAVLATNVKTFGLQYYSDLPGAAATPISASSLQTSPDTFAKVTRVDISLTLERLFNGDSYQTTTSLSIKRIN